MKIGPVVVPALPAMPRLAMPRLGLAAFRRRIVFHTVFVLLGVATLALAVTLLAEEKQRSRERYEQGFKKSLAEMAAQLRHPAGQLALLNAALQPSPGMPAGASLAPVVLPFSAIDFDDPYKARQAVEMSGCALRYPDGASLCVAVGNNAFAGGFIYVVGELDMAPPVPRERGVFELSQVHRAQVHIQLRGGAERWTAPFELTTEVTGKAPQLESLAAVATAPERASKGRLTGFMGAADTLDPRAKPVRDFRGWLWQEGPCVQGSTAAPDCPRRTLFSLRVPVEAFKEALFTKPMPAWPPADLANVAVRVLLQGPGPAAKPLFDSSSPGATAAFSLAELAQSLTGGETLRIERVERDVAPQPPLALLRGRDDSAEVPSPWLLRLIDSLPTNTGGTAADTKTAVQAQTSVHTASGRYLLTLRGELANVDRQLGATATRLAWFVGAMLAAIALAWLFIELGLVRRVALLTRRSAQLTHHMTQDLGQADAQQRLGELDVSDLRGKDELGILAGSLAELLARVKDNLRREHIRAAQERDMWHAVGHEIMSPLQSLMVLHGAPSDASHRYVQRMQQAVRVLYGAASPSEALAAAPVQMGELDLQAFAQHVASNAHFAGIEAVDFEALTIDQSEDARNSALVHADEYSLEDVVTHVLRNADQHRTPGTRITLRCNTVAEPDMVQLVIFNEGPHIEPALLDKIFEYGVSTKTQDMTQDTIQASNRGQGLFVARTYMAKMGGTIEARNVDGGVVLLLHLPRAASGNRAARNGTE